MGKREAGSTGKVVTKQRLLVSWVGGNDLKAVSGGEAGPILSTLKAVPTDSVQLLYSYPVERVEPYLAWLRNRSMCRSLRTMKNCLPPSISGRSTRQLISI